MTDPSSASDETSHGLPDLTGRQLADYQVLRRLGRGAMADVYLAEQSSLQRQVALKVLHASLANDTTYVERFHNEARAAASLLHANIVQIYEVGEVEGIHFIAQEYVAGHNVAEAIRRQGPFAPGRVVNILYQVAAALAKADDEGWVHRDIKPENIMLSRSGEVKVADFGLARAQDGGVGLTQVGMTMGTPLYMSPEQIEGRQLDIRSDLYSLGVTAYYMIAGEPPFRGDTALSVAVQHLNKQPPSLAQKRPDTPPVLVEIVQRLMAKQPQQRFEDPASLAVQLRHAEQFGTDQGWAEVNQDWAGISSLPATGPQATAQLSELMRTSSELRLRRRSTLVVLAAVAASIGIGWLCGTWFRPRSLLADAQATVVSACPTPRAQLYQAKMIDTAAAWRAVDQYFPPEHPDYDHHCAQLAHQGLIRYYLHNAHDYEQALRELHKLGEPTEPYDTFEVFAIAARAVAHRELGQTRQAEKFRSRLTVKYFDDLSRLDPELDRRLKRDR